MSTGPQAGGEREERHRDRGRSSDTRPGWHEGRPEGPSRRSRSRDNPHRPQKAQHSGDLDPSNPGTAGTAEGAAWAAAQ